MVYLKTIIFIMKRADVNFWWLGASVEYYFKQQFSPLHIKIKSCSFGDKLEGASVKLILSKTKLYRFYDNFSMGQ